MISLSPGFSKARRANGRRSFTLVPARILTWAYGRPPISETQAVVALGYIFRQLSLWKTNSNVFDLMRVGSGSGYTGFPKVVIGAESAAQYLRGLFVHLAHPETCPKFVEFARNSLGFRSLETPIVIHDRVPPHDVFSWLRDIGGVRLKKSPNRFHPKAYWLHEATLRLNSTGTLWQLRIQYSYRHESSSWTIGLDQQPGEKLEDFEERAWAWFSEQAKWRHPEEFYHRFMGPADGMKKNELRSCSEAERKMDRRKKELKSVFSWGVNCPGFWENMVAEPLVIDANEQYREVNSIQMTGKRLRTMLRWIREDKKERSAKKASTRR